MGTQNGFLPSSVIHGVVISDTVKERLRALHPAAVGAPKAPPAPAGGAPSGGKKKLLGAMKKLGGGGGGGGMWDKTLGNIEDKTGLQLTKPLEMQKEVVDVMCIDLAIRMQVGCRSRPRL